VSTSRAIPPGLTERERAQALDALRRLDAELQQIGTWLESRGELRAGALLMDSWERLAQAGWLLLGAGGLPAGRPSPNGLTSQF